MNVTNAEAVAYIMTHKRNGRDRANVRMFEALLENRGVAELLIFERGTWRWERPRVDVVAMLGVAFIVLTILCHQLFARICGILDAGNLLFYCSTLRHRVYVNSIDLREAMLRGWV